MHAVEVAELIKSHICLQHVCDCVSHSGRSPLLIIAEEVPKKTEHMVSL